MSEPLQGLEQFVDQNDRHWVPLAEATAEIERLRGDADKWEVTAKASEHRVAVWKEKVERLRGTLEYILEQAKADYPTVLSVIKANAKAALDDEWQKTYAAARDEWQKTYAAARAALEAKK